MLNMIANPDAQQLGPAIPDDVRRALTSIFSAMEEHKRYQLLPAIVEEVVYDVRRNAISVTFDPGAVRRMAATSDGHNKS